MLNFHRKRVELPETLQELGDAVFANNKSLESVRLPASLEAIGNAPFAFCPITTIEVKEGSAAAMVSVEDLASADASYVYY
ncbi:MAG: leucine-rich repeat domain-containing protein [Oscillospiraceae bacterium]|nr:leucine-rich repeat domain-containing protein [Oscillospiraceae bacterium]